MTSKPITALNGIMNSFVQNASNSLMSTSQTSFSSVMQQTSGQNNKMQDVSTQIENKQPAETQKPVQTEKNTKVAGKLEKDMESSRKPAEDQTLGEAEAALEETALEIVEEVADTLGLSKEEVEMAMETLGLSNVDLLQTVNVTKLLMNLNGETDMLALATNEGLYADINQVIGSLEEALSAVQETFGISDEEMNGLMAKLMEAPAEVTPDMTLEQPAVTDVDMEENLSKEVQPEAGSTYDVQQKEAAQVQPEKVITFTKNGEEVQAVVETDANSGVETITQESTSVMNHSENEGMMQNEENHTGQETGGKDASQNSGMTLQQNTLQNQNVTALSQTAEITFTDSQVQDIMDQIMEYVKIQIKPEASSLEMQLHPESLGTLNIHISSKEGILTAQFTAQNEAVKNVIEGQVATLQQNLNEQGIKVEAVEVNVDARPFDRSLDQGQNEQNSHQSEASKKKGIRKIQLRGLESMEEGGLEEMEEADKLTADMMIRNGNTVDYLA